MTVVLPFHPTLQKSTKSTAMDANKSVVLDANKSVVLDTNKSMTLDANKVDSPLNGPSAPPTDPVVLRPSTFLCLCTCVCSRVCNCVRCECYCLLAEVKKNTLRKLRSKTVSLFFKDGGTSTLPKYVHNYILHILHIIGGQFVILCLSYLMSMC